MPPAKDNVCFQGTGQLTALDAADGRLAGVEGEDVVDEGLAGGGQGEGFGWVGRVVAGWVRLADFEVFAGRVGRVFGEVRCVVDGGGHGGCWGGGEEARSVGDWEGGLGSRFSGYGPKGSP